MGRRCCFLLLISMMVGLTACSKPAAPGIEKLDHLIFIVMENRSFDHYFGKYPNVDGLPENICVPDPSFDGRCAGVYHDRDTVDIGGPHTKPASDIDVNGGRMDGFIEAVMKQRSNRCARHRGLEGCEEHLGPQQQPDVMSFHTRREIPLYWQIADDYVLQDRMFAPTDSWTLPAHLYLVSAWSAYCRDPADPMSCSSEIGVGRRGLQTPEAPGDTPYAWTDITWLLHRHGVSWSYFVAPGSGCTPPGCEVKATWRTKQFQNPLPGFTTITETGQESSIRPYTEFIREAQAGELSSVSWVMPALAESDHPDHSDIAEGQRFVAEMVNAVMSGPDWDTSAIFITWDDWGGFYDHVEPPRIDVNGYGIRVPGLIISPYAKEGYVDHQTLTFDAYLKLIEDRFMGGARLDPETDGRPDSRPTVREDVEILGDLVEGFDFAQSPRPPILLDAQAGTAFSP